MSSSEICGKPSKCQPLSKVLINIFLPHIFEFALPNAYRPLWIFYQFISLVFFLIFPFLVCKFLSFALLLRKEENLRLFIKLQEDAYLVSKKKKRGCLSLVVIRNLTNFEFCESK
jgi:hypothetical protein